MCLRANGTGGFGGGLESQPCVGVFGMVVGQNCAQKKDLFGDNLI